MKFPLRAAFKLKLVSYIYISVIMSLVIFVINKIISIIVGKKNFELGKQRKHIAVSNIDLKYKNKMVAKL